MKNAWRWIVGGLAAALIVAACSGQFGLWTPPMMLLGPPLFILAVR